MKRVTGIGGIFFKCKDPTATKKWYQKHLGFNIDEWSTVFSQNSKETPSYIQWSPMSESSEYYSPSSKEFMINYRVENLESLVTILKEEGVTVLDDIETFEYGKFVHILDLDGQKIELWEPNDADFSKVIGAITP